MQFRSIGWYTTKSQIAESDAGQAARRLQSHRKEKAHHLVCFFLLLTIHRRDENPRGRDRSRT